MNKKLLFLLPVVMLSITGCEDNKEENDPKNDGEPVFVINVSNKNTNLVLSDKSSFETLEESHIVDTIPGMNEQTFERIMQIENLDSEVTNYHYQNENQIYYFKHTFFLQNSGTASIDYQLKVLFTKNVASKDGQSLDSTARVMLFENEITSSEHSYTVYAKESESGDKEAIASDQGLAEKFESKDVVTTLNVHNFQPDEIRRYTYVLWLEGSDPDSNGPAPENAYLKLGIDINAQLSN